MALVVFLRGVNVGGHRTFRPSLLAKDLRAYDVVNIGAAGTFVVRKPGSQAKFRAALLRRLKFKPDIAFCDGRDLLRLDAENPFEAEALQADHVRFVTMLSKMANSKQPIPVAFPAQGEWFVRVFASRKRFVFGVYRRHMKTIGYLGQIDKLFGVPVTTRNWNTIAEVIRILKSERNPPAKKAKR